jgi:hypothetical protein
MNTIVEAFRNPKTTSPFLAGMLSVFDLTQASEAVELKKDMADCSSKSSVGNAFRKTGEHIRTRIPRQGKCPG